MSEKGRQEDRSSTRCLGEERCQGAERGRRRRNGGKEHGDGIANSYTHMPRVGEMCCWSIMRTLLLTRREPRHYQLYRNSPPHPVTLHG